MKTKLPTWSLRADYLIELATVARFACKDDSRPLLMNLKVDIAPNHVTVTATDSYRLAIVERDITSPGGFEPFTLLFPADAWASISRAVLNVKNPDRVDSGHRQRYISFEQLKLGEETQLVTDEAGGMTWRVPMFSQEPHPYPNVSTIVPKREDWDKADCATASFNVQYLKDITNITPFNATKIHENSSLRVRTIDPLRTLLITSKDERTKVMLMPVRME